MAAGQVCAVGPAKLEPMPTIPDGVRFSDNPPEGWSHIILFVEGRIASGDVSAASSRVRDYASLFNLVILADVAQDAEGVFRLHKAGIGFTTKVNGHHTVVTADTANGHGANLGFVARQVLEANEESLKDIKVVVRSRNHLLFDAPTIMLYEDEHEPMMVRYLIWASPKTGRVSSFVWLLENTSEEEAYRIVEDTIQMLPENMREDRVLNVKADRFLFGIPAKDAFALVRIPQGRAIPYTDRLSKMAVLRNYDASQFTELLQAITAAVNENGSSQSF
jgi:hypothetical protein